MHGADAEVGSPARVPSLASTILFSPQSLVKADRPRAVSAPRGAQTDSSAASSAYPAAHRIDFAVPEDVAGSSDSATRDRRRFYDLRQNNAALSPKPVSPATPTTTSAVPKAVHHDAAVPCSSSKPAKPAVPIFSAAPHPRGVAPFKNPPAASRLVTTADTLSANKAAKKAVLASIRASVANHHYTAATLSSASAVTAAPGHSAASGTPSRKPKSGSAALPSSGLKGSANSGEKRLSLTPSRKERDRDATADQAHTTPLREPASRQVHPFSPATPQRSDKGVSSAQKALTGSAKRRKARRVTISAQAPTELRASPSVQRLLAGRDAMDVDSILSALRASGGQAAQTAMPSLDPPAPPSHHLDRSYFEDQQTGRQAAQQPRSEFGMRKVGALNAALLTTLNV